LGNHHHIFVGDLSQEVTDSILLNAFSACPGCSDARVMWDHATGRSRGYGFVSFESKEKAQYAIDKMDGAHVGARCIRCGWAQHKTEAALPPDPNILDRSDPTNTNIYVGNLPANLSDSEMRKQFSQFGTVVEMKLHRKGNYGFVRYRSHTEAVQAIVGLNGQVIGGRQLKCSWGRHPKVPPSGVKANLVMAAVAAGVPQVGMGVMPHAQPMMAHQQPPSMVAQMPHAQMMGQVPDAEQALMQGVGGMSLYGRGQGLPLQMSQEPHARGGQLQPHQLDPSRQIPMYGMPPSSRYSDPYNAPLSQYNNPGNQYFQK
jgi:nucleolysin TIA-1/TIAR